MILSSIKKLTFNYRSSIKKNISFSSVKFFKSMQVSNAIINQSYQNGISDFHSEGVKLRPEKKSDIVPQRPIAVCGPSGSGKSTLLKRLLAEYRDYFDFSISHTTRKPRPNEVPGKDYYFVSRNEMQEAIAGGNFIEYAEFSGNIYGTSKDAVSQIQNKGKICILDVEMVGVKNLKKTSLNPKFIFVKPPSLEILEQRLRNRNTESEESLQKRLSRAHEELVYGEIPGNFDIIITNDDLEEAYKQLKEYLFSDIEEAKNKQQL